MCDRSWFLVPVGPCDFLSPVTFIRTCALSRSNVVTTFTCLPVRMIPSISYLFLYVAVADIQHCYFCQSSPADFLLRNILLPGFVPQM